MRRDHKIRAFTKETKSYSDFRDQKALREQKLLLPVEKSHSARIETVVAADYLYFSGINLGLENWGRGTQCLYDVFNVRFYCRVQIVLRCGFNCRLDGGDQRLDVSRSFAFGSNCFSRCFDGAATLVAKHQNQTSAQLIDGVLDAAQPFVIDHVSRHAHNK